MAVGFTYRSIFILVILCISTSLAIMLPVSARAGVRRHRTRSPRAVTVRIMPAGSLSALLPQVSTAQALQDLDSQRAANGIPGGLTLEPILSAGCQAWASDYHEQKGQYPHEELPSQPGYAPEGDDAAKRSDLAGTPGPFSEGSGVGSEWSSIRNPWLQAPLHETALFNPAATTAWYGATSNAACIGTEGTRAFAQPAFFSVPGNGTTDVPVSEAAGELPFTPQEAAGWKAGETTGPAIILWYEGAAGPLLSAKLTTATTTVRVRTVTPDTPVPRTPPGWPQVNTVGPYSGGASFVIPERPLAPDTPYTLEAIYSSNTGSQGHLTNFTTGTQDVRHQVEHEVLAELASRGGTGSFTMSLKGRALTVKASGLALGYRLQLSERTLACNERWRPPCREPQTWRATALLTASPQSFLIPAHHRPRAYLVGVFPGYYYGPAHAYLQAQTGVIVR